MNKILEIETRPCEYISVEADCGDRYCYREYDKPCYWLSLRRLGSIPVCRVFPGELLTDEDHRVLRCDACLRAEVGESE